VSGGWRLEFGTNGLQVTQYEENPVMEVDKDAKTLTFRLRRDRYIPVAVLKAFVKMGLCLIPDRNLPDFGTALAWVTDPDHQKPLGTTQIVLATFLPGPTPAVRLRWSFFGAKMITCDYLLSFLSSAMATNYFKWRSLAQKKIGRSQASKWSYLHFLTPRIRGPFPTGNRIGIP
jgi:hypothetical protein